MRGRKEGLICCALNGKMRVKIASFGAGLLAGLGSAIGYSQVRHLRLKESDVQAVSSDTESQEQELFK